MAIMEHTLEKLHLLQRFAHAATSAPSFSAVALALRQVFSDSLRFREVFLCLCENNGPFMLHMADGSSSIAKSPDISPCLGRVGLVNEEIFTSCFRKDGTHSLVFDRDLRKSTCLVLPLPMARTYSGAAVFVYTQPPTLSASDSYFLQELALLISIALDNASRFSSSLATERQLEAEREQFRIFEQLSSALVTKLDLQELVEEVSVVIRRSFGARVCTIVLHNPESRLLSWAALELPSGLGKRHIGRSSPLGGNSPAARAIQTRKPFLVDGSEFLALARERGRELDVSLLVSEGVQASLSIPLIIRGDVLGAFNVAHTEDGHFAQEQVGLITKFGTSMSLAIENALAHKEISEVRSQLAFEKRRQVVVPRLGYERPIIGSGGPMKEVLDLVSVVARASTTVLILGETGTGKELIARAIHDQSGRRNSSLITVNCASIPANLLESELFGHEKGAFTGAVSRKIGRLELANNGTLFLDEIGDMPVELQPKLLRVLQEREFERLGGAAPIPIDVRIVAATNRDLTDLISRGLFRKDLYYRLSAFPITLPPLRERREDIPQLANHFARKFGKRMDKFFTEIPAATMRSLQKAAWPGNIRELENVLERAALLSSGPILTIPFPLIESDAEPFKRQLQANGVSSLRSVERQHICSVLKETGGRISGPKGAAALLGVKRTTLNSKLQRLGITQADVSRFRAMARNRE
jgi:formate hydrogenlyase transcriptional activator